MVLFRLLANSFALVLAGQAADSEGLHLLQTSAHAKVSAHTSPACAAAKDALKAARQAKGTECPEEPADYVEAPKGSSDKYKIFPPPEPDDVAGGDLSSLKSCDQGWMAHVTQNHVGHQCWNAAITGSPFESVGGGPWGTLRVTQEESKHLTPGACLDLVYKISRLTGICNPNASTPNGNWPRQYRFTGCAAEWWDQSGPDVLKIPDHLLEEKKFANLRGHTKFGQCMICGKGKVGPWESTNYDKPVSAGKALLIRRDWGLDLTRMTCILNPEEKDGFELQQLAPR